MTPYFIMLIAVISAGLTACILGISMSSSNKRLLAAVLAEDKWQRNAIAQKLVRKPKQAASVGRPKKTNPKDKTGLVVTEGGF